MDGAWVELRVHGVSGTPPESMLGSQHVKPIAVEQVAGDDYSRFFTRIPGPSDHELEGYHWGSFTSGTWRHALTLMFLPFGMVNASQFMLLKPAGTIETGLRVMSQACLRVLGLLLTGLFSFAFGLILIDLIGWRWSPKSGLLDGFRSGLVLPACVVVAAVGVLVLSQLNRPGRIRTPKACDDRGATPDSDLHRDLYLATTGSRMLRRLHMTSGLVVIALLADLARTGTAPDKDGGPMRMTVVVTLLLVLAVVLFLGDPMKWGELKGQTDPVWRRLWGNGSALPVLFAISLVLVESFMLRKTVDLRSPGDEIDPILLARLGRFDEIADGLMWCGLITLGLLAVGVGVPALRRRFGTLRPVGDEESFRPYAWGLAPFLIAALAVFVGIGFSAAAATAVASTLELNADKTSEQVEAQSGEVKVGTTLMLDRVAYAWGLTMIEFVVLAAGIWIWYLSSKKAFRKAVDEQFESPDGGVESLPDGWPPRVARAMFVARLKDKIPIITITIVVVGVGVSVVQVLETGWLGGEADDPTWPWIGWLSEPRGTPWSIVAINIGAWALVAGAGGIVALSRGALKDSGLRRGINVVWDVFGFWPHVVHPFGPEPYSRWTVFELRNRIRHHLGRVSAPPPEAHAPPSVVVCAHSQGSVIAFASLLLLRPEERQRVALLTCGAQLRVIYPRAFPAYFNFKAISAMFTDLDRRWVNLYRTTDPLAGPVLSWKHSQTTSRHLPLDDGSPDETPKARDHRTRRSGHDWRLIDPVPSDPDVETGAVTAVHGHHDFWRDPTWDIALRFLRTLPRKPPE